jgi:hypothetical protein
MQTKQLWWHDFNYYEISNKVLAIGKADLKALNDFFGSKKFLMGYKVCNEDASVFGVLAEIFYVDTTGLNKFLKGI